MTAAPAAVVRKFATVQDKSNGVFSGLTVKNVNKGNDLAGMVVLLGLRPELVGNTTVEKGLLPGLTKGLAGGGVKTTSQKIGTQDVVVAKSKTTSMVAWYKDGTAVLILGSSADTAPTLAFAKAYLAAA